MVQVGEAYCSVDPMGVHVVDMSENESVESLQFPQSDRQRPYWTKDFIYSFNRTSGPIARIR
jgi:hypothetical protein